MLNRRAWNIALRTAHLAAMGVLLGGHAFDVDPERLMVALADTTHEFRTYQPEYSPYAVTGPRLVRTPFPHQHHLHLVRTPFPHQQHLHMCVSLKHHHHHHHYHHQHHHHHHH